MAEHVYEIGVQKTTGASAGPIVTIVPAALAAGVQPPNIREIGIFNQSGVAAEIGFGYPAAAGTGGASVVSTVQLTAAWQNTGDTTVVSSYTTLQPTAPTAFFRRAELQGAVGAGIIWTWNAGEFILWAGGAVGGAPVLWQISALAVTYDVYVKVTE